ncbi:immunoglobulin-like domain-containing protein [Hyalangium rubrum]|uniref:DUF5011 domain-containing protein n=1 Tax=Hyalangium rubrum TaxID=3103134 RepID=A0ABU5H0F8_9BACT|nr:immunoglobulin-like domain-containing protein [Hyalangium sp. s54d21]MDY7226941.1 DUF5011 domain-containing protein [Hyalangium sp. s54d21]
MDALSERCEASPPFSPNFEPELQWAWTGGTVMPDHKQVMMTPVVVDVSGDGVPDVVFNAFAGSNHTSNGVMRAIDGATGADLWAVSNANYRVRGAAQIAAGDIDFDGQVELCTVPEGGTGIICFEHDGAFKFRTSVSTNIWGGPSFADLDGDGNVEILNGNHVFSHTGALEWEGSDNAGGSAGALSFAADIDGDGLQEVINDRAIYRHDGTLKCANTGQIGHGLAGVGNFDADPNGEVVVVWGGRVSLMDDTCALLWTASLPGGGTGGAPTIADFDNDGQPEVGVAGGTRYVVFETNGTVKWSRSTTDQSNLTGSTAFDFEGDGQMEIVYADEQRLRIYDGATGATRFETAHSSSTAYEAPVVVDVDGDHNAEIVLATNSPTASGAAGIRVFRDRLNGWVSSRRVWNQHAYSVTHIHEDGTIPTSPPANWLTPGLNTFRVNPQGPGFTPPALAPDLIVTHLSVECSPTAEQLALVATVSNRGDQDTASGMLVAFFNGDPSAGGTRLGTAQLANALPAGQNAQVKLWMVPPDTLVSVYAVADNDGAGNGQETECREDNNALAMSLMLSCDTGNRRPVALCQAVTVPADPVTCQASASVNNGSHDPDNGPQPLSISESPTGPFGPGTHEVTLTASDGEASAVCSAPVTVVDVTPPTLTLVGDPAPVVECGYALPPGVIASDTCSGDLTAQIEVLNFNNRLPGFYEVQHRVTDAAGNTTVGVPRWVNVVDNVPPALQLLGDSPMVLECGRDTYVDPGAEAYDACSGTLPVHKYNSGDDDGDGIPGESDPDDYGPGPDGTAEGTYSVQYLAMDRWNVASAIRSVKVLDTTPPTLTLNGPEHITLSCGQEFSDPWVEASDLCYGNLGQAVRREGGLNHRVAGTYTLTYTVEDAAEHSAPPVYRTVTVVDDQGPSVQAVPFKLWPSDGQMNTVRLSDCATLNDACEQGLDLQARGVITSVSSDEPEDATGGQDGNTLGDIVISGPSELQLRAERNEWSNGRVYTVNFRVTDTTGNVTSAQCKVHVPPHEPDWAVDEGPGAGYTVP